MERGILHRSIEEKYIPGDELAIATDNSDSSDLVMVGL